MSTQLICCICLYSDEHLPFVTRAMRCMDSQKINTAVVWSMCDNCERENRPIGPHPDRYFRTHKQTVGALRNELVARNSDATFIAHFDVDDFSAPDRLSIQLAHIQKTGKLLTGFHNMMFYDVRDDRVMFYQHESPNYALGTSLFYRREAWERVKFPDATPEDNKWRMAVGLTNCESISSLRADGTPIMIQTIHGGNASAQIVEGSSRWMKPTPAQEREVRRIMHETMPKVPAGETAR